MAMLSMMFRRLRMSMSKSSSTGGKDRALPTRTHEFSRSIADRRAEDSREITKVKRSIASRRG